MKKPTGPRFTNDQGRPFKCAECGKPRMKGTALCKDCTEKLKTEQAERHKVR